MKGQYGDKNVEKNRNQLLLKKCRHEWKFENENWWKNFRERTKSSGNDNNEIIIQYSIRKMWSTSEV